MFASSIILLVVSVFSGALVSSASPVDISPRQAKARVVYGCTAPNTVALTFDDGPYNYLYDISKTLTDAGAKGTFFFNGNNWGCIYDQSNVDRVKFALSQGHQIASHTWSHPHLNSLSLDQVRSEFQRIDDALRKIAGVVPAFMRPPYGEFNDQVLQVAAEHGEIVTLWDLDSRDSLGASVQESEGIYDQAIAKHPHNILALNHEVYETTAHQVLPYAVQKLQAAGYRLVTVAECLGIPAYQSQGQPSARDGSWTC